MIKAAMTGLYVVLIVAAPVDRKLSCSPLLPVLKILIWLAYERCYFFFYHHCLLFFLFNKAVCRMHNVGIVYLFVQDPPHRDINRVTANGC